MENNVKLKRMVRLSTILNEARDKFERLKENLELDRSLFSEEGFMYYLETVLIFHKEDWEIINDIDYEQRIF